MQLLLFLLMTFTFLSCAGFIVLSAFTKMTGFSATQLATIAPGSPQALINAAVLVQGVENMFIFLLPALVFAYLAHPRPMAYLGLRAPGRKVQPLLAMLVMLGASPILMLIENLIGLINFGPGVKAAQLANEHIMSAFMTMPDAAAFFRVFIVMAIVPAIGEELFFRGVLMRFARQRSRTMLFPIVFTAAVFSYAHTNIYSYLSIFLAGVLLAVIYDLTGSLWCSIAGHFIFNGSQIVISYIGNSNPAVKAFMANDTVPYYIIIAGAAVFGISFYLLLKNRTPLLPNWADDFTREELVFLKNDLKG